MLKNPSHILQDYKLIELRGYGVLVYRKVATSNELEHHDSIGVDLFTNAFNSPSHANVVKEYIFTEISSILDNDPENQVDKITILPPLFIRADVNFTLAIRQNVYLIALSSGPVIPVMTSINDNTISLIINLYNIVSDHYYNETTAAALLIDVT